MKYDLKALTWQEFEVLAFKCLQLEISRSIKFIDGGNDKARDFLFAGVTGFFGVAQDRNYLFQAKHKSGLDSFSSLSSDLVAELNKVYIKYQHPYDFYCLVTNLALTGNQFDELEQIFSEFIIENELDIRGIKFGIYSYRHFESVIDQHDELKWNFPSIIKHADFRLLLREFLTSEDKILVDAWLKVFEKNKNRFVFTAVYEEALIKLSSENILLLSGPPKSGKTFTAQMIMFNYVCSQAFAPYQVDHIEDFFRIYNKDESQVFLFDDSFGRHDLDLYRADTIDRKFELIFELVDDRHRCIFTSREYIVRSLLNYTNQEIKAYLERILVETSKLSFGERQSIFKRYFLLKFAEDDLPDHQTINVIVGHKNFSPETIRAYFEECKNFNLSEFLEHLKLPDKYLEKVFTNLPEQKRVVLLALLFSLKENIPTISYSFKNISHDLQKRFLVNLASELDILDGSLIVIRGERHSFYHPSMFDFFVKYLGEDVAVYRSLLLSNINLNLLSLLKFEKISKPYKIITVAKNDLDHLLAGLLRIVDNPHASVYELNTVLYWMSGADVQLNFQIKLRDEFRDFKRRVCEKISILPSSKFIGSNLFELSDFFELVNLNNSSIKLELSLLKSILISYQSNLHFWRIAFRLLPLLPEDIVFDDNFIGKDWLNQFYIELSGEVKSLGSELYGDAFPAFEEVVLYEQYMTAKQYDKASSVKHKHRSDYKRGTNKRWYPRYRVCREKMTVLKLSGPYGYKIYSRILPFFEHLTTLEDNQKNRYLFNRMNKWWAD